MYDDLCGGELMEYTVKGLGRLAGVSGRTLRYYDEIKLLKPARVNSSGYRIYGQAEVDRLQQILFYKELGFSLNTIKDVIDRPTFDEVETLKEHRQKLLEKKAQLDLLLVNVNQTIHSKERKIQMSDQDKFEGFKQKAIHKNEAKYGVEIREKYGEEVVENSNAKVMNKTQEEYDEVTLLSEKLMKKLAEAYKTGDPAGKLAQEAADLHRQWLSFYWDDYSKEVHAGLAEMYVADERFQAYYDAEQEGTAVFLRDSIQVYTGAKK